ncbi:MAG: DNA polymerase III subunit gamma/tau [Gammaproteobacteria bacterium]|nr:DNA polymerase III subunit gamma/tau [Gammaproteobacteria bacterium]
MSYQVLARKWRPRNFEQMVGQEHVLRALTNALDSGRLHHAFLFTGTRGVGKTTLARILAKSLNCETGISSHPCGECQTCREIDDGRYVDLIEVDAASRTKVEDTRELLDNVQYAPTRGRYKVYLVDEVHMLSNHSFNALLKTLEEPPPHVKFLLATTDPQKLPVTILSRCLQFNLKRLHPDLISEYLAKLLQAENITFDAPALKHLARAADGSMRDALSLLDQAIAFGGGQLNEADVKQMLGTIEQTHIYTLLEQLAVRDAEGLMATIRQLNMQSPDHVAVLAELLSTLHYLAVLQQVPTAYDESMGDQERLLQLSQQLSPEDVQLFYQIGVLGRRDLPYAPDPASGVEMVLLRMLAFRPQTGGQSLSAQTPSTPTTRTTPAAVSQATPAKQNTPPATNVVKETVMPAASSATASTAMKSTDDSWTQLVPQLQLSGILQQFAMNCAWHDRAGNKINLILEPSCENLLNKERIDRLQEALQNYYGQPVVLSVEVGKVASETPAQHAQREKQEQLDAATQAIESDANVQKIVDTFGAKINTNTIQPVK